MVLDTLSSSLKNTLKKIANSMFVDDTLINELVKEIQKALLKADVNVQLVFDLTKRIKERALNEVTKKLDQRAHIVNIVYEELVNFLGGEKEEIILEKKKPFKIMLVGLFGSGKTTTVGKLSKFYTKRGYKVATLGLDVYRPAAFDQLEQISKQVNVPYFIDKKEKNPLKIYEKFKNEFNKYDLLIIDTAGRDALSNDLIEEIKRLNESIKPEERLLVISSDIGQAAQTQAKAFHDSCKITGVIITKLDGTAKGGGALSACAATEAKVKFIGIGEKVDDLEQFNPKGFVSRLLGMGDLESLLEKVKTEVSQEKAEELGKRLLKGDYNLVDLYDQMESMKKLGPLSKIMELIPGMSNANIPKELLDVQEDKLKRWKYIMDSCTKEELEDPESIDRNRVERIAKGAGVNPSEIRDLLKQYKQSKKLVKIMKGASTEKGMDKVMRKFKGKIPGLKF
ncbi:signal recognition particle protein [Candidatus Woesearchaeota archaeon]|nr:signal recognition particle protein [Candidatus Woesearchaeota archaeon]